MMIVPGEDAGVAVVGFGGWGGYMCEVVDSLSTLTE